MAFDLDQWIDIAKECKYLPENDLRVCLPPCNYLYVCRARGEGYSSCGCVLVCRNCASTSAICSWKKAMCSPSQHLLRYVATFTDRLVKCLLVWRHCAAVTE